MINILRVSGVSEVLLALKCILSCLRFEQNVAGICNDGSIQNILKCSVESSNKGNCYITTLCCRSQYRDSILPLVTGNVPRTLYTNPDELKIWEECI